VAAVVVTDEVMVERMFETRFEGKASSVPELDRDDAVMGSAGVVVSM
jgi:hypothetical protein